MPTLTLEDLQISGRILASALKLSKTLLFKGKTTKQTDLVIEEFIRDMGGEPSFLGLGGFPNSICASFNEVIAHGLPSDRRPEEGDLIKIDIGVAYNSNHTDAARTFSIGDKKENTKIIQAVDKALDDGINKAILGNKVGDISYAIQRVLLVAGYKSPLEIGGHGIGLSPHLGPFIPNSGPPGIGSELSLGMCIAIEPLAIKRSNKIKTGKDGFSLYSPTTKLTGHAEDTVVIMEVPLILTRTTLEGGVA